MSPISNPFCRGYQNLGISRELLIAYDENCSLLRRRLHSSQSQFTSDQIVMRACLYDNDIALITEQDQDVPVISNHKMNPGVVLKELYAVKGDFRGLRQHVGDVYSLSDAEELIRRLGFQTGYYSRCWEISTIHLTPESLLYLYELADSDPSPLLLFEPFKLSGGSAVGVRLTSTPWTDENLQIVDAISADELLREQRRQGVPEDLLHVLGLAAAADIRMLVFDEDSGHLEGLPRYQTP